MSDPTQAAGDAAASAADSAEAQARTALNQMSPEEREFTTTAVRSIGSKWWVVLLLGILSIIIGLLALFNPTGTVTGIAVLLGIWLVVSGVVQLIRGFTVDAETGYKVLTVISGALSLLLGIICFRNVTNALLILAIFIAIGFLFRGITDVFAGFGSKGEGGWVWLVVLGGVEILAGVVMLGAPALTLSVFSVVLGIVLLIVGIFELIAAFRIKGLHEDIGTNVDRIAGA